jgi:Family of unknown function (DUF6510)
MEYLDGNAMAGTLRELFGVEMTVARGVCAECGNAGEVATLHLYNRAPGMVPRVRLRADAGGARPRSDVARPERDADDRGPARLSRASEPRERASRRCQTPGRARGDVEGAQSAGAASFASSSRRLWMPVFSNTDLR